MPELFELILQAAAHGLEIKIGKTNEDMTIIVSSKTSSIHKCFSLAFAKERSDLVKRDLEGFIYACKETLTA